MILGHMECSIYQNYTASEVLVQGLAGVVNQVGYSVIMMMSFMMTMMTLMIMMMSGRCRGDGEGTKGDAPEV